MALLQRIKSPADLRKLSISQLGELAAEMRDVIFNAVSQNGGHLASNLGVVELTIALHYVYNFGPYPAGPDRLLFDVGHQCYSHKILTGRAGQFPRLCQLPRIGPADFHRRRNHPTTCLRWDTPARPSAPPSEWPRPIRRWVGITTLAVSLTGDASIVNGLAFEGLNAAGTLKRQLLMILNDNGMSISKPQGAFAQYLERVRVSDTYEEAKKFAKKIVDELPAPVSHTIEGAWQMFREGVKHAMWPGADVRNARRASIRPIDGHDLPRPD